MILQSLVAYYEALAKRGEISKLGWSKTKAAFALDISESGQLLRIIPLSEDVSRGKKTIKMARDVNVPEQVKRSSGILPNFLCDNSAYILGIKRKKEQDDTQENDSKDDQERALQCYEACKKKHIQFLSGLNSTVASAIVKYFESWQPDSAHENDVLKHCLEEMLKGGNIVFSVENVFAHESPEIQEAWNKCYVSENGDISEEQLPAKHDITKNSELTSCCLVTGEKSTIARLHPSIKKVRGAQSSGASLVSFNGESFESYLKEQGDNAPVGTYAAFAYGAALNKLIEDEKHRYYFGDTTMVFWAENADPQCQDYFSMCIDPQEDENELISKIMSNLSSGTFIDEGVQLNTPFYVLGLAPNASRLSVRFFLRDTFGNMMSNLKRHHDRLEIVKPSFEKKRYLSLYSLLNETVNQKSTDKTASPLLAGAVLRSILSGSPYPTSLFNAVMLRIKATPGEKINRNKAAIIKAYLLAQINHKINKEVLTVSLNEEANSIPYVLGRLFSVLEALQESANPGINATIKDRFFNSACATPNATFPVLLKLSNHHLRKIQEGTQIYYKRGITTLLGKLNFSPNSEPAFPKHFSLEEQGTFILGYYHQTQKRFEKKNNEEQ